MDINETRARECLTQAKAITALATKEGRGLSGAEQKALDGHLEAAKGHSAKSKAARVRGLEGGDGFKSLASQLVGDGRGEVRLKDLTYSATDAQLATVEPGIAGLPIYSQFIYGVLPSSDCGTSVSITDFRLVARSIDDGSGSEPIERDVLDGSTEKARLNLTVEGFTEDVKTLALVVEGIPRALLASESALAGLLSSEMRKNLNAALDAHVVAAIEAATPDHGGSGGSVEELVRSGITAMQLKGVTPDVVIINPTDAETVDLHTAVDSIIRFPFGLKVVVSNDVDAGAPMLLDTSVLGHLYTAGLVALSDPYTTMTQNTVRVLNEFNVLCVVRNADGAFIADGAGS